MKKNYNFVFGRGQKIQKNTITKVKLPENFIYEIEMHEKSFVSGVSTIFGAWFRNLMISRS